MTQEELIRFRQSRAALWALLDDIKMLDAELTAPKTQHITGMPSAHGYANDVLADKVAKLDAMVVTYWNKLVDLTDDEIRINEALSQLSAESEILLRYRYILCNKWSDICAKMGRTPDEPMEWGTIHARHRRALKELEEKTENGGCS